MIKRYAVILLPVLLLAVPLVIAARRAFPLYDDGWLVLLLKEVGAQAIRSGQADRPLYGELLLWLAGWQSTWVFVGVTALLWGAFAFTSALFWSAIAPQWSRYAPLAATLTLAPIVSQTQFSTVLNSVPCVLPAIFVYMALVLLADAPVTPSGRPVSSRLVVAAILVASGVLISEYAISASVSGMILLLSPAIVSRDAIVRRYAMISSAALGIPMSLAYLVYRYLSQTELRPDVNPEQVAGVLERNPAGIVFNLLTGFWHSVAGTYGAAFAAVTLNWTSKSTLLALFFGVVLAALVVLCCRNSPITPTRLQGLKSGAIPLSIAVLAGLAPIALFGRPTNLPGFASRFLIPVVPIATALTLTWAFKALHERFRSLAVVALALIAGNSAVLLAFKESRDADLLRSTGERLRGTVQASGGNVVAVSSLEGMDYQLTGQAASDWEPAESKRFWLYDRNKGEAIFGERSECRAAPPLHVDIRNLTRSGPIDSLLWVEFRFGRLRSIEAYCIPSADSDTIRQAREK